MQLEILNGAVRAEQDAANATTTQLIGNNSSSVCHQLSLLDALPNNKTMLLGENGLMRGRVQVPTWGRGAKERVSTFRGWAPNDNVSHN